MNSLSNTSDSPLHKHHDFYFVLAVFSLFFAGDLMWSQLQEVGDAQDYAAGTILLTMPSADARDAARMERDIKLFDQINQEEARAIYYDLQADEPSATDENVLY